MGPKAMAQSGQQGTQLDVVVDLTVLRDLDLAGLVSDRLSARLEIDDRQATRTDHRVPVAYGSLLVRSAMTEDLVLGWVREPDGVTREELLGALAASLPALVEILH